MLQIYKNGVQTTNSPVKASTSDAYVEDLSSVPFHHCGQVLQAELQLCKVRAQTSDKEHPPLPSEAAMTDSKRSARTSRQFTISKPLISQASTLRLDFRLVPTQDELETFPQTICSTRARPVRDGSIQVLLTLARQDTAQSA